MSSQSICTRWADFPFLTKCSYDSRVPLMFCVLETLQPAICVCACASDGSVSHAVQTIRIGRIRRMRSELTDARDRESSKSITQGTYQEDGPSDDDRRSMRKCAL